MTVVESPPVMSRARTLSSAFPKTVPLLVQRLVRGFRGAYALTGAEARVFAHCLPNIAYDKSAVGPITHPGGGVTLITEVERYTTYNPPGKMQGQVVYSHSIPSVRTAAENRNNRPVLGRRTADAPRIRAEVCEYSSNPRQEVLRRPHYCVPHTVCNVVTTLTAFGSVERPIVTSERASPRVKGMEEHG